MNLPLPVMPVPSGGLLQILLTYGEKAAITATGLAPGTYTITFKAIGGLNSPADMGLDLEEGESVTVDGP